MTPDERAGLTAQVLDLMVTGLANREYVESAGRVVDLIEQRDSERDEARGRFPQRWITVAADGTVSEAAS